MSLKFNITIDGYYRDELRALFPSAQAVYFVYRGVYNNEEYTCSLKELIFIGYSIDIHEVINNDVVRNLWLRELNDDESLFYACSFVNYKEDDCIRILRTLIYELNPTLNQSMISYSNDSPVTIIVEGNRHAFIPVRIDAPSY